MHKNPIDVLALYSADCLTCSHLVSGGAQTPTKCHYKNGNADCPASEVRLVVTGRLRRMANALIKARANHNVKQELKILAALAKESPISQRTFYKFLESGG